MWYKIIKYCKTLKDGILKKLLKKFEENPNENNYVKLIKYAEQNKYIKILYDNEQKIIYNRKHDNTYENYRNSKIQCREILRQIIKTTENSGSFECKVNLHGKDKHYFGLHIGSGVIFTEPTGDNGN